MWAAAACSAPSDIPTAEPAGRGDPSASANPTGANGSGNPPAAGGSSGGASSGEFGGSGGASNASSSGAASGSSGSSPGGLGSSGNAGVGSSSGGGGGPAAGGGTGELGSSGGGFPNGSSSGGAGSGAGASGSSSSGGFESGSSSGAIGSDAGGSHAADGGGGAGSSGNAQDAGSNSQVPVCPSVATAPTWSSIWTSDGFATVCTQCHKQTKTAASAYTWLAQQGIIAGTQSPLVNESISPLYLFTGTMPPAGDQGINEAAAKCALVQWVAAGAKNN